MKSFGFSTRYSFTPVLLTTFVTAIFVLGLIVIFSATSAEVFDQDLDRGMTAALLKQFFYASLGIGLAWLGFHIGFDRLLNLSPSFYLFFLFCLFLTLLPGIGKEVNGSKRWLMFFGFSFQPSEFMKIILPLFFVHKALFLQEENFPFLEVLKLGLCCLIPLIFIFLEPNNGTAAVMGINLLVLCFLMHVPMKYWLLPVVCLVFIGVGLSFRLPYVAARIKVYVHPEQDLLGKGHQPYQAKIAAGSGKLWGKGPGNSWQKLSFLPEAQNDYIAAIFAEEFGFVGIFFLILLYALVFITGISLLFSIQDLGFFYFSGSFLFLFAFQAFLNLGVVSGLLPSTGLNLPLFSQGGSSLIANIFGISLLLQVAKNRYTQTTSKIGYGQR